MSVFEAILEPKFEDIGPPRKRRKNANSESIALIAANEGKGCILAMHGESIEGFVECSKALDDNGLDDAPDGLTIWEGRVCGWTDYWTGEPDAELCGEFRELTVEEWRLLQETDEPWEYEADPAG